MYERLPIGHLWTDITYGLHKCIPDFHFHSNFNLNYLKEVQLIHGCSQYILLIQEILFLYRNCNNIENSTKQLLKIFEKRFQSYLLRISVSTEY